MKVLKSVFEIDENRESAQGIEKVQSVLKDFSLELIKCMKWFTEELWK